MGSRAENGIKESENQRQEERDFRIFLILMI